MLKWPSASETTFISMFLKVYMWLYNFQRSMLCDKSYGVKHCLYKSYKYLINGESHFISHYCLDFVRASGASERALGFLTIVELKCQSLYVKYEILIYIIIILSRLSMID